MDKLKVLIFGDDSRAFLAVVRSLGRHGLQVHACPFDYASAALRSRHIAATHRLPPYNLDPAAWVQALRALLDRHRFQLLIPCDDRSILPLHRHRVAWGETRVALPNDIAFAAFFDKQATRELAIGAGVPVAPGEALSQAADATALARRYGLPLVLKPRQSFALDQIATRRSVEILRTEAALRAALTALDEPERFLVEGFFEGHGVGVSVLAAEGAVLQAFQHHRVHESGPTGGSTYRVSAPLDPELLTEVAALARASSLHGVAMFEFRKDMATQRAILLEVNARFWGSLPLAIAAGIDFPAQLYELLVHDRKPPRVEYRIGQYARSLGNDAYRLVRELGDRTVPLPVRLGRAGGEIATGLGRNLLSRERLDSFAADDLRPWRAEWSEIGTWIAGGAIRRMPLLPRIAAARRRRAFRQRLRAKPGESRRVLVLCLGNICRSPFAALLLQRELQATRPDIEVASAGFIPREGRPSPPTAIGQAAAFGVDLSHHRSRFADDDAVTAAHALLIFDGNNLAELDRRGLPTDSRVVFLGDFGEPMGDIEDPYGGTAAVFQTTYARIVQAVNAAVAILQ